MKRCGSKRPRVWLEGRDDRSQGVLLKGEIRSEDGQGLKRLRLSARMNAHSVVNVSLTVYTAFESLSTSFSLESQAVGCALHREGEVRIRSFRNERTGGTLRRRFLDRIPDRVRDDRPGILVCRIDGFRQFQPISSWPFSLRQRSA